MDSNILNTLKSIDYVIRSIGDNRPLPRKRKLDHVPLTPGDLNTEIPIGKEEQFRTLYQILQQGLVGSKGVGPNKELRNISSLLFGPRGSGKSFVLDACISALKLNTSHDQGPKFRVVRLNGIALKGHDVTVVLRVSESDCSSRSVLSHILTFRMLHRKSAGNYQIKLWKNRTLF